MRMYTTNISCHTSTNLAVPPSPSTILPMLFRRGRGEAESTAERQGLLALPTTGGDDALFTKWQHCNLKSYKSTRMALVIFCMSAFILGTKSVKLTLGRGTSKAINAVIHIGPHKTGTTAIQHYSKVLHLELASDKYEMPWMHLKNNGEENQVHFATCFLPDGKVERTVYPCREGLLKAGLNIAQQNNNSLLVSAETFAATEVNGVAELKEYLDQAWNNVTIVATYRRYYEWIVSFHHEINKIKPPFIGNNLWQAIQKNETERLYPSIQDTLSRPEVKVMVRHNNPAAVVARFKEFFPNVVVMNYHDKRKSLLERFYCDAIPHAPNTCKKVIEMTKNSGEEKVNGRESAAYEELVYAAHRSGIINVQTKEYCEAVKTAIKSHQEKTLKLSNDDFPRACPSSKILDEIWNISLHSEEEYKEHVNNSLDYEESFLSNSLKDDFDVYSRTSLCHIDVNATIQSQIWRDFFAEINVNVNATKDVSKSGNITQ